MSRTNRMARGALPAIAVVAMSSAMVACNSDARVLGPTPNNVLFTSYVALGNSITAGFQSGGINDSTQAQSYAVLLAKQMNTRFAFPSLQRPGCPPPIANFQTQARVGGAPALSCALRNINGITSVLNNVAVPGIASADPTAVVGPDSSILVQLILGGKTMVQKALDAHPTFATVWVGNNDILGFAIEGNPGGATPQATFVANYAKMINELTAGASGLKGVLIGVVQVAGAPVMFTSQALLNPQFVGALSLAAGKTITVDPTTCKPQTMSLIAIQIVAEIKAGVLPPIIACAPLVPPIGVVFVLDAPRQAQVATIVNGYNAYIKAKADSIGFAYYDPNTTLAKLAALDPTGPLATHVPNLASATATFGPFVTLDGIHPSAAAQMQIANDLIDVINAKYGTALAKVPTS